MGVEGGRWKLRGVGDVRQTGGTGTLVSLSSSPQLQPWGGRSGVNRLIIGQLALLLYGALLVSDF